MVLKFLANTLPALHQPSFTSTGGVPGEHTLPPPITTRKGAGRSRATSLGDCLWLCLYWTGRGAPWTPTCTAFSQRDIVAISKALHLNVKWSKSARRARFKPGNRLQTRRKRKLPVRKESSLKSQNKQQISMNIVRVQNTWLREA